MMASDVKPGTLQFSQALFHLLKMHFAIEGCFITDRVHLTQMRPQLRIMVKERENRIHLMIEMGSF